MNRSAPLVARFSAGCAAVCQSVMCLFSARAACWFANWWNIKHMRHPNWCGACLRRTLVKTAVGTFSCDLRDGVQSKLLLHGVWESRISQTLTNLLRPGDVFIDVGANIGYFSLLASRIVGPKGLVVAFEPLPENVEHLIRHTRLNGAENIAVVSVALGQAPGLLGLYSGAFGNVAQSSVRAVSGQRTTVLSGPLDAVLDAATAERVRLVKIDVEGAELMVLKGMTGLFRLPTPPFVVCEITDQYLREVGHTAADLIEEMRSHGYAVFLTTRQSDELWVELPLGSAPPIEQVDALFVPPGFTVSGNRVSAPETVAAS